MPPKKSFRFDQGRPLLTPPINLHKSMNDQASVLVTGSDGLVGRHLVPNLAAQGNRVIAASRTASKAARAR
jgi:NAD dependent epimerase/dehydratase family